MTKKEKKQAPVPGNEITWARHKLRRQVLKSNFFRSEWAKKTVARAQDLPIICATCGEDAPGRTEIFTISEHVIGLCIECRKTLGEVNCFSVKAECNFCIENKICRPCHDSLWLCEKCEDEILKCLKDNQQFAEEKSWRYLDAEMKNKVWMWLYGVPITDKEKGEK